MSDSNVNTNHIRPTDGNVMAAFGDAIVRILASTTSTTQKPTGWRLAVDPNFRDRRDAKAAASDLRCTQQFLEDYRLSVLGRSDPDRRIQLLLVPSYDKAVAKYQAVAHSGERATNALSSALEDMQETLRLLYEGYAMASREILTLWLRIIGF
jgi:hypothetical protein